MNHFDSFEMFVWMNRVFPIHKICTYYIKLVFSLVHSKKEEDERKKPLKCVYVSLLTKFGSWAKFFEFFLKWNSSFSLYQLWFMELIDAERSMINMQLSSLIVFLKQYDCTNNDARYNLWFLVPQSYYIFQFCKIKIKNTNYFRAFAAAQNQSVIFLAEQT